MSRTAISKWESGRGYPNLESLKAISALFSVSIDDLLSNRELMELAETVGRAEINKVSGLVFGILDLISAALLFLPFFGQQEGVHVRAVPLTEYTGVSGALRMLYTASLVLMALFGAWEIILERLDREKGIRICKRYSTFLHTAVILLFALSRQAYVTAFLFLLFLVKGALLLWENRRK